MKPLVNHPVDFSLAQLRKIRSGGAVTIKPSQFREAAKTAISVLPGTARRIATAMRKMKGIRISLKPEEDVMDMETGGSLKSFGRTLKRGIVSGANDVGKTLSSEKAMNTYKKLGHYGLDIGVPAALGLAGEALGGPVGAAAAASLGSIAADQVHNRTGFGLRKIGEKSVGEGFFKGVKKLTGVNKTAIVKTAKRIGKEVVSNSAALAGEAITAYTGNPALGISTKIAIEKGGHKAIDSGSVKKGLRSATGSAKEMAKDFAIEAADSYIDTHLSGDERRVAERALAGEFPSAKDLIYDYAKTKAEKFEEQFYHPIGGGHLVSVHKLGMGSAYVSMPYRRAMRGTLGEFQQGSGLVARGIPDVKPMSDIQTLSPIASVHSAQMNPFVLSASPQMSQSLRSKSGGSFLPAGQYGGSFVPAG